MNSKPWPSVTSKGKNVGDGYDFMLDAHGVYFKVNFAGDGTLRPLGGAEWGLDFQFKVGEEQYQRSIVHDGVDVTTTFEALQWTVADGNVFQVKAWAPVADWQGKSVTDIVIVASVDGELRDTAPGGIHLPATGTEVPVEAPATPIFPPLGEGRIVESVALPGPEKYLDVTVTPKGNGTFEFAITNPLKEQGQHVHLREAQSESWTITSSPGAAEIEGGGATTFLVNVQQKITNGVIEPILLDFYTDIGGRQQYYAYLDGGDVALTSDSAMAAAASLEPAKESPGVGLALMLLGLAGIALRRRQ